MLCKIKYHNLILLRPLKKWLVETLSSVSTNNNHYKSVTVGVDCDEGPPVPIPNTEVKLICAENTWLVTAREDR